MNPSEDLLWRGLIKDRTFTDPGWLDEPKTFYHGVDASADSLTIGNLAAMMLARRLIESGWQAVLLVGGATTLIGDPGGKDSERVLKSREEVQKNTRAIKGQISQLFGGKKFELVDNYDWFSDIGYLDFLRDIGKSFSMTELMQRDFVSARMNETGSGISYAEFSYSLIQGYDYLNLYQKYQTVLQVGGSDQWGNMLSGVALVRKKAGHEVHAMSMPLVVDKSTGRKFGKTEAGAVWLDPSKTSSTQFYQFWLNAADEDVEDYLKIFALLPKTEIEELMARHNANPSDRLAQTKLAQAVTKIVHGQPDSAESVTKYLTSQVSLNDATDTDLEQLRAQLPSAKVPSGSSTVAVLVSTGLAASNTEARRLLADNAVYINGKPHSGETMSDELFQNGRLLMRRGKAFKDSVLVEKK